ncbi:MAG: AbrB/MazE/SpoVT family DNA-binding domain-containing protein [Terriglobia bacterium]
MLTSTERLTLHTCGFWAQNAPCKSLQLDKSQVRRYLTLVKTTVSSKGQIVLPAEFRQMDRIKPGQEFEVERLDRGEYRLIRRAAPANEGAVDWLLACPYEDFFLPVDSESTDTI